MNVDEIASLQIAGRKFARIAEGNSQIGTAYKRSDKSVISLWDTPACNSGSLSNQSGPFRLLMSVPINNYAYAVKYKNDSDTKIYFVKKSDVNIKLGGVNKLPIYLSPLEMEVA